MRQIKSNTEIQAECRECLASLLNVEQGLNDWEITFIEDKYMQNGEFTTRQIAKICDIYDRVC